jgi:hypothetical protein
MDRKQKEREYFTKHGNTFKKLNLANPTFILKMAFFEKGRLGRVVQFYESELKKNEDLYIEFIDVMRDEKGAEKDYVPQKEFEDRPLFKLKANPYYAEEYEIKERATYSVYIVPASELMMIQEDGTEISYSLYEKRKEEAKKEESKKNEAPLPRLQTSLFPNFEEEYPKKESEPSLDEIYNAEIADAPLSEMTILDFASIMLMKPVSAKPWLNDLINKIKSEI